MKSKWITTYQELTTGPCRWCTHVLALITTKLRDWGSSYLTLYAWLCGVGCCYWSKVTTALVSFPAWAPIRTSDPEARDLMPLSDPIPRSAGALCHVIPCISCSLEWKQFKTVCPQSVPSLEKDRPRLGFVLCLVPTTYQTIRMIPMSAQGQCVCLKHCGKKCLAFE